MEEKILAVLAEVDEDIVSYKGDNLFDAGILDSLKAMDLVAELEDALDIDIDARYVVEENFKTKYAIIGMVKKMVNERQ